MFCNNVAAKLISVPMLYYSYDTILLSRAFVVYVWPILEYNCVVWSPPQSDIDKIENILRPFTFTKRLVGLSNDSYNERRRRLQLWSLEMQRVWFDLHVLLHTR